MITEPQQNELVRFDVFEADLRSGELRKDGAKLKLQELPFRLLASLLEHPGEVVTREELQAKLWPTGTFVDFERGLATALSKLREALGDAAETPRFIETLPRRGYRLIAPVFAVAKNRPPALPLWQKYAWFAAALVLLVMAIASVGLRKPTRPLTDKDVLVLADFTNSTGDQVFNNVLRDALAYQLEESPFLKVLDDGVMRQDLELMRRSPQEHITDELAHDICVRENDRAMLSGSIVSLGKSYAIELKATSCQTGRTLAREHAEAADKEHVLQGLAKAAQRMRAKLGESLSSIEKLAPPFEAKNVTTGSLEAFQAFNRGIKLYSQGRYSEAAADLQRATELDPDLAFAWFWRAYANYYSGGRERYGEYFDKAWALRTRVSAYELFWITDLRPGQTTGQYIQNSETWARAYPRDSAPLIALGTIYGATGEFEKALAKFQESTRLNPPRTAVQVIGLMLMYGWLDRFDEAKAVAEEVLALEDAPMLHFQLQVMAYAQGDREGAARQIRWHNGRPEEYLSVAAEGAEARARGQLRRSRELQNRAADLANGRNLPDTAAALLKPDPGGDALIGNCETPRRKGLGSQPLQWEFDSFDAVLALCGTPALAKRAEEANKRWVRRPDNNPAQVQLTRAAAQLSLGRPDQAMELLQSVGPYERTYPMANYIRGLAYLKLKKGAEAAAEFQKIIDRRGATWGPLYPLSYVGLARGQALAGNTAAARKAYESFFELWNDADPDVPILIQARQEYAAMTRGALIRNSIEFTHGREYRDQR